DQFRNESFHGEATTPNRGPAGRQTPAGRQRERGIIPIWLRRRQLLRPIVASRYWDWARAIMVSPCCWVAWLKARSKVRRASGQRFLAFSSTTSTCTPSRSESATRQGPARLV